MLFQGIYFSVVFSQLLLVNSQLVAIDRGMDTTAVEASVSYSATFQKEFSTRTEILFWNLGTKNLARIDVYADTTCALSNLAGDIRIFASVQKNLPVYNLYLNISDVNLNDSGSVELLRSVPSPAVTLTFLPLNVKECDKTSDGIDTGINVLKLGSYSYEDEVDVNCSTGYTDNDVQVTLECLANATWSKTGSCVLVTTTTTPTTTTIETLTTTRDPKVINRGRMSGGDIAGTVLTCIFILECICLCVFVFALNYDLSLKLIIGLYVAGICLSIIGIFMSFFGSSTAGTVMNSVEIAGTVLGSVGITVMLGGIVMQALKGVGSKDTTKQIPDATHMDATSKEAL